VTDLEDCIVTFEQVRDQLEAVEKQLAHRLGLQSPEVRRELIARDQRNELFEDELVAEWHDLYSSYLAEIPSRPSWVSVGQRIQRVTADAQKAEIVAIEPDERFAARITIEWTFERCKYSTWYKLADIVSTWESADR
jgi:hypothetical protein